MKLKVASLVIFLAGSALFTGSIVRSYKKAPKAPRSFVVQYLVSRSEDGGPLVPYEFDVRAVSASGEWKETRYSFEGKVSTWGGAADGLYIVSGKSRQYYGESNLELARTAMRYEEGLKKHPQLVRTEVVAGLKTYVLREPNGSEGSFSPETGITTLKEAIYSEPDSDTVIHLQEALNIEFRELSQGEAELPDLPVAFDVAEKKAQSLRAAGNAERAEILLQAINRLKTTRK